MKCLNRCIQNNDGQNCQYVWSIDVSCLRWVQNGTTLFVTPCVLFKIQVRVTRSDSVSGHKISWCFEVARLVDKNVATLFNLKGSSNVTGRQSHCRVIAQILASLRLRDGILFYWYRNPNYKPKTVWRPFIMGTPIPMRRCLLRE